MQQGEGKEGNTEETTFKEMHWMLITQHKDVDNIGFMLLGL